MAFGRPTKYLPEFNKQVVKLCMLGATDQNLADFFEVAIDTITEWKKVHPEFSASIKEGKEEADAKVAASLFHRATGYSHPDVDIKMFEGDIIKTDLIKHYPPETIAAIFWLKNRRPDLWRDKQEHKIDGSLTIKPDWLNVDPEKSSL